MLPVTSHHGKQKPSAWLGFIHLTNALFRKKVTLSQAAISIPATWNRKISVEVIVKFIGINPVRFTISKIVLKGIRL